MFSTTTNTMSALAYRRALTQHASVVDLVIALHDTLAGDLRRAAAAMEQNDIATRCDQMIHGFQILMQLETMLDMKNGGPAAAKIQHFYRHVRSQMLAAQFSCRPEILYKQIEIVLEVREAWQEVAGRSVVAQKSGGLSLRRIDGDQRCGGLPRSADVVLLFLLRSRCIGSSEQDFYPWPPLNQGGGSSVCGRGQRSFEASMLQ